MCISAFYNLQTHNNSHLTGIAIYTWNLYVHKTCEENPFVFTTQSKYLLKIIVFIALLSKLNL